MRRLYISIHLHDEARHKTAALLHALPYDAALKFVPEESLHLTLVFLGSTPEERIPLIEEAIREAAGPVEPFTLVFTQLGAFPELKKPHVIWFGIEERSGQLARLVEALREALEKRGINLVDHKPFLPHLTLARVRGALGREVTQKLERIAAERHEIPGVKIDFVELMESQLSPQGPPVYSEVFRQPL